MEIKTYRDFASFLDAVEPIRPYTEDDDSEADVVGRAPTIPFDYLSVAEELHSGRIQVAPDRRKQTGTDTYRVELEAYLDAATPLIVAPPLAEEHLPSIEPTDIATELDLDHASVADFTRIRRRFAFANHPDRVEPHLRERAMVRMQLANMMIDDAQERMSVKR